ncbi:MAG TPA: ABC transporter ATP-binding protein [Dongiaceae bacterium]|jgi:branched-chain amino acid transport system ATP-binding protein
MIQVEHLSKSFGGIHAVDDCSLQVARGSITGLIGPNGAGKSTLFNIIAGLFEPSSGHVRLDGEDVTGWPAHLLFHRGLARTFQIAQEFSRMTVIENLMAVPPKQSGESLLRTWFAWGKVVGEERGLRVRARQVMEQLRLTHLEREYAGNLSGGQKKLLELGRTMMIQPKVVLLDELGAGVNRTLLGELAGEIERLNRAHGYTFFVIEHDMDLIARLCDPVIVMAEGKVLTQGTMAEIRRNDAVIEAYLGARHHKPGTLQ